MTRAARRDYGRHQEATLNGLPGVVLSRAEGGEYPQRPDVDGSAEPGEDSRGEETGGSEPGEESDSLGVEQRKYVYGMEQANEAGEYEKVLEYGAKLTELGGEVPLEARYYRGVALMELWRDEEATAVLTGYLEEIQGREDSAERMDEVFGRLLELESRLGADEEAYEAAQAVGTSASYGVYLREHPSGRHVEEARRLQGEANDEEAYRRAQSAGTSASYGAYLREYPSGRHAEEARRLQADAKDDEAFRRARSVGTSASYGEYLNEYASGRHAHEARRLKGAAEAQDDAVYERAKREGTSASYGEYLREYPTGRHVSEASRLRFKTKDGEAYEQATREGTSASYGEYLRQYPNGRHADEARRLQAEVKDDEAYERARATDTSASYGGYLRAYANGRHAAQARQMQAAAVRREEQGRIGGRFRDCEGCPELVVVPSGSFMMGSPASEEGRYKGERPVHRVTISEAFAVGVYEVTRGEFRRFAAATGHNSGGSCDRYAYVKTDRHPVVCVSWRDVQAYVKWLSGESGEEYRLLSESEWEYVARGGTSTARYWGGTESGQCRNANGADRSTDFRRAVSCDDGYERTGPVGSYEANGYGLYDVLGNVWEWTEDCWNESYDGAPSDGRAWESGDCGRRVVRGGSWFNNPTSLRSARRIRILTSSRNHDVLGFRVARTLGS